MEASDLETQRRKDALMQLVMMRLKDEEGVDARPLITMIESELLKENNLIVKARAI